MATRKLRDIEVSAIGMGCMGLSHGYGEIPDRDYSIEAIRKAYDYGCTFFDTAESYGPNLLPENRGHNEKIVGEAVHNFRNDVVLATKLHLNTEEVTQKGLENVVREHLAASLNRLQTDYADIYYLHRINPDIPVEEAVIPYCISHNIGLVPFSPIASGFLSGKITAGSDFSHSDDVRKYVPQLRKENMEANQPVLDLLESYAEKKNATKAQISLSWMLHKYPNVVPIPGSKNQDRILENLGAWNVVLSDEEFAALEKALEQIKVYGHRGFVEQQGSSMKNWNR